jgi:hypothetical protein
MLWVGTFDRCLASIATGGIMMNWIQLLVLPLVFVFAITPTPTAPAPEDLTAACLTAVTGIQGLRSDLEFPDYLMEENAVKTEAEFDVNAYFTVLKHLTMRPGYVLDYVYYYDGMGGGPAIYARPEEQTPYQTFTEYNTIITATPEDQREAYWEAVEVDGTPASYIELAVLRLLGSQFYLFWHSNYNDMQILCDTTQLKDLLSIPKDFGNPITEEVQQAALELDVRPQVDLEDDMVQVQLVGFTNWGGFIRLTFTMNREAPYNITLEDEVLVPYDCGIMF